MIKEIKGKTLTETKRLICEKEGKEMPFERIVLKVKKDVLDKWIRVKGLVAHQHKSEEEIFDEICNDLIKKYSPAEQSTRSSKKGSKNIRYISPDLKKRVWQKASSQCEFVDPQSGRRCDSVFQLEIDHVKPLGIGGKTSIDNLRLMCRNHNIRQAIKSYGKEKMENYLN